MTGCPWSSRWPSALSSASIERRSRSPVTMVERLHAIIRLSARGMPASRLNRKALYLNVSGSRRPARPLARSAGR
jgi:hypothetical protein